MRILIIEDDKITGPALKAGLEAESYAVDLESDGSKGFYRAKTNDYDFIILDNILPGKQGSEICKELRYNGKMIPILMLTVQSEMDDKITALEGGADDYLTKPYSYRELSARIKALMRRPKQIEPFDKLIIDDLTLDRTEYVVSRNNQAIHLTPKEFSLLEYLIKNQGKVVTRRMIMEHVWDESGDPFSNTIETHIRSLRRKIDTPEKIKLIHTIPGRGYKIDITA